MSESIQPILTRKELHCIVVEGGSRADFQANLQIELDGIFEIDDVDKGKPDIGEVKFQANADGSYAGLILYYFVFTSTADLS